MHTKLYSFCQGTTQILLTKIPMFREVILMSFACPHCGNKNSEIQPGAPIQDLGVRYSFQVKTKEVRIHTVRDVLFKLGINIKKFCAKIDVRIEPP